MKSFFKVVELIHDLQITLRKVIIILTIFIIISLKIVFLIQAY